MSTWVIGQAQARAVLGRPHWFAAHGRRAGWNLLRACESREQGRDGRDTPRGRRLGDDGVPRCPCAAPRVPMSMRCTSGHGAMSRLPRPPRRPRPNPVPMRTCCDMESCAHGTHCRTGSTCTVRSLLQLAGQSQAAQEKCHVGMAAAEKRARLESAFMAASTESWDKSFSGHQWVDSGPCLVNGLFLDQRYVPQGSSILKLENFRFHSG